MLTKVTHKELCWLETAAEIRQRREGESGIKYSLQLPVQDFTPRLSLHRDYSLPCFLGCSTPLSQKNKADTLHMHPLTT